MAQAPVLSPDSSAGLRCVVVILGCSNDGVFRVMQGAGKDGSTTATLATRSFALHCIVMLLDAVTSDASPLAAAALLRAHAQAVVQCAFEAIEDSSAETLKPPSLLVLCRLLQSAQSVSQAIVHSDAQLSRSGSHSGLPYGVHAAAVGGGLVQQSSQSLGNLAEDSENAVCMDVYAAPYVTALKTCLKPDAPVAIATAAVRLAEEVLTSGMLHEDGASVQVRRVGCSQKRRIYQICLENVLKCIS